jgi:thioesterase domain-containing protein/acyl carrier protein
MPNIDLDITGTRAAAPSYLEQLLQGLMVEALGQDSVGIDDDFFRLGGDSLAAENLFLAIEESTGHRLPLSTLFKRPTVRLLAELIANIVEAPSWSTIVNIRDHGTKLPLFIVPAAEVIAMAPLAAHLDADRRVYCFQFVGLDGKQKPLDSIEDIAAHCVSDMRRIQPAGPYHLLGACIGGLIALEIAQRLRASGEEIGLLCLADTPLPAADDRRRRMPIGLRFVLGRIGHLVRDLARRDRTDRPAYVRAKASRIASVLRNRSLPVETKAEIGIRRVIETNHVAARRYLPRIYAGAALYVRSRDRPSGPSQARRALWQSYFPAGLAVQTVACRDSGALFNDHAAELAAILSGALSSPSAATLR